ncbi:MAG TPA: demethoxyubiquinone hydroxylase family protein [Patescibacteria group bacterium]|nr:demethoxyubiquinone hydroxylase family protein [Patescibacteria group bacterium]
MARKLKRRLPGDKPARKVEQDVASMIRVNHAGEYGAKRIYAGQLAVLGHDPKMKKLLTHMAEQEQAHLDYFEKEIIRRGVRPTALHPVWHVAGFALGAITARISPAAAMACTVAVEEVISEHYGEQLAALTGKPEEKDLREKIKKFKAEEEEHGHIGLANEAETAPAYRLLSAAIKRGSKLAIEIAKRI